jgi:hypothetical protein
MGTCLACGGTGTVKTCTVTGVCTATRCTACGGTGRTRSAWAAQLDCIEKAKRKEKC